MGIHQRIWQVKEIHRLACQLPVLIARISVTDNQNFQGQQSMTIDTTFFTRCIQTLDKANSKVSQYEVTTIEYEMYRSACVKEFEIILEQSGKLLRKCLKDFAHSPKAVDRLVFKEVFRQAAQHGLLSIEQCERWLEYRDNRNNTAHDYGKKFAEYTLKLLPGFILDATALEQSIKAHAKKVEND